MKTTNTERYGCSYTFENKEIKNKSKATWLQRYGVENPMLCPKIKEQAIITCLLKYGQTNGGYSDEAKQKIKETCNTKYKTDTPIEAYIKSDDWKSPFSYKDTQDKCKETILAKYGVEYITQLPECINRIFETKRKHGTFNTSKEEKEIHNILINKFGENNIETQYKSKQYPYHCDFYIKPLDLYVECNFSWTHGHHPYTNCENDKAIIEIWKSKHTKYYDNAIETWTIRDVKKRKTAKDNNLNYIELFDIKSAKIYINNL